MTLSGFGYAFQCGLDNAEDVKQLQIVRGRNCHVNGEWSLAACPLFDTDQRCSNSSAKICCASDGQGEESS